MTVFTRGYTHHLAASFPVTGPLSGQDSGRSDPSVSASWPLAEHPLLDRCAETAPDGMIHISKPLLEKNRSSRNPHVPPRTKRSEGAPQLGDYVDRRVADFIIDLNFLTKCGEWGLAGIQWAIFFFFLGRQVLSLLA